MKLPLDRSTGLRLALIVALALGAIAATGCGDDEKSGGGKFDVSGKVDHFAGPTPLVVRMNASSKNSDGDVLYRWRFDDGTSSTKPEVTHTFPKAGYYQVILDGRDEKRQQRPGDLPVRRLAARPVGQGPAHAAHQEGRPAGAERAAGAHGRAAQGAARGAPPPGARADPGLDPAPSCSYALHEPPLEHASICALAAGALLFAAAAAVPATGASGGLSSRRSFISMESQTVASDVPATSARSIRPSPATFDRTVESIAGLGGGATCPASTARTRMRRSSFSIAKKTFTLDAADQ